jgi:hypothetical protein
MRALPMMSTHGRGDPKTCQHPYVGFPTATTFQTGYGRRKCQRGVRVASVLLGARSGRCAGLGAFLLRCLDPEDVRVYFGW